MRAEPAVAAEGPLLDFAAEYWLAGRGLGIELVQVRHRVAGVHHPRDPASGSG